MLGFLLRDQEVEEISYLLKRELDELSGYLEQHKNSGMIKRSIEERYNLLLSIFLRVATPKEKIKYNLKRIQKNR